MLWSISFLFSHLFKRWATELQREQRINALNFESYNLAKLFLIVIEKRSRQKAITTRARWYASALSVAFFRRMVFWCEYWINTHDVACCQFGFAWLTDVNVVKQEGPLHACTSERPCVSEWAIEWEERRESRMWWVGATHNIFHCYLSLYAHTHSMHTSYRNP